MAEAELLTNILKVSLKLDTTNLIALFKQLLDKSTSNDTRLSALESKYVSQHDMTTKLEGLEGKMTDKMKEMVDDCMFKMRKDMQTQAKQAVEKDLKELKDTMNAISQSHTETSGNLQILLNSNYSELILLNKKADTKITTLNATVQQLSARNRELIEQLELEMEKTEKLTNRVTRINEALTVNSRYIENHSAVINNVTNVVQSPSGELPGLDIPISVSMDSKKTTPRSPLSPFSPDQSPRFSIMNTMSVDDPLDFDFDEVEAKKPEPKEKEHPKSDSKQSTPKTPQTQKRSLFNTIKRKTSNAEKPAPIEIPRQPDPAPSQTEPQETIIMKAGLDDESLQQMRDQKRLIAKMHKEIEEFKHTLTMLKDGVKRKLQLLMDSNSQRMFPLMDQFRKETEEKLSYKVNKKDMALLLEHKADKVDLDKIMQEIAPHIQQLESNMENVSNQDRKQFRTSRAGNVASSVKNLSNFKLGVNNNSLMPIGHQSPHTLPPPTTMHLAHQQHPANTNPSTYDVGEHAFHTHDDVSMSQGRFKCLVCGVNDTPESKPMKRPNSSMDDRPRTRRSGAPTQLRPLSALGERTNSNDDDDRNLLNIVGTDGVIYKGKDANLVQLAKSQDRQSLITGLVTNVKDETYQKHVPLSRLEQKVDSSGGFTVFQPIDYEQ